MEEMNKLLAKRWVFGLPQLCGHQQAPVSQHRRRDRLARSCPLGSAVQATAVFSLLVG